MTILIKGGHVINPATQMDEVADVLIEDQKIKKIGKELPEKEAERVINADGCYVMPGFIDMHVHFRDPGFEQKEDIYTGMQAAAHGGYTTVLTMPNTKPVADNPDIVNYVHNKAKSWSCIHVLQVGAVTKGQQGKELADIKEWLRQEVRQSARTENLSWMPLCIGTVCLKQRVWAFRYLPIAKISIWYAEVS